MRRYLHDPKVIALLRRWKPLYAKIVGGPPDYSRAEPPESLLKRMDGRGVFLFSFVRCGTTVFCEFLRSHPQILSFGEILSEGTFHSLFRRLHKLRYRTTFMCPTVVEQEFYRYVQSLTTRNPNQFCVFDLKLETLHTIEGNFRLPGPDFDLFTNLQKSGNPVIFLERKDLVARYVSGQLALRTQQYHSFQRTEVPSIEPFAIDIKALDREIDFIKAQTDAVRRAFTGYDRYMELSYEDLFQPGLAANETVFSSATAQRVAEFLGVPDSFDTKPGLEKMTRPGFERLITNYPEVERYRGEIAV